MPQAKTNTAPKRDEQLLQVATALFAQTFNMHGQTPEHRAEEAVKAAKVLLAAIDKES